MQAAQMPQSLLTFLFLITFNLGIIVSTYILYRTRKAAYSILVNWVQKHITGFSLSPELYSYFVLFCIVLVLQP